jgi:hypothetical protein
MALRYDTALYTDSITLAKRGQYLKVMTPMRAKEVEYYFSIKPYEFAAGTAVGRRCDCITLKIAYPVKYGKLAKNVSKT